MDLPTVTIRRIVITKLEAMKYFYDCEFLEGTQRRGLFGRRQTNPTIDLISIGIVSEDGREYYAVSKEFNLKEAWNRYDEKVEQVYGDMRNQYPEGKKTKVYWIRENVLMPIFHQLNGIDLRGQVLCLKKYGYPIAHPLTQEQTTFSYRRMKYLIGKHGKTRIQIEKEVKEFVYSGTGIRKPISSNKNAGYIFPVPTPQIDLYGYYSAYDHVALCWLFGKMMDLPKGFPMYTHDLKQMLDDKQRYRSELLQRTLEYKGDMFDSEAESERYKPEIIKDHPLYPKQTNEHNALADAKWNKELYEFLKTV